MLGGRMLRGLVALLCLERFDLALKLADLAAQARGVRCVERDRQIGLVTRQHGARLVKRQMLHGHGLGMLEVNDDVQTAD